MSTLIKGLLKANSPICEFKRFRGKINIQRPQKPHFKRQLVMDVCKPIYPSKFLLPQVQQCSFLLPPKQKEANTVNPYEEILVNECANWFNHSKMIGIFHVNPLRMEDRFDTFKALKKQNMHIMNYGKKIIAKAIGNSPFKALQVLFETHTDIVFSEEIKVKQMLQITKGLRQLILIGGVVDGKFLSRNEMVEYSKMPSIDIVRAQLCQTLEMCGSNLVNNMNQHQSNLVYNLDNYVKINSEPPPATESTDNENT